MQFCQITAHTNTLASELVADIFWDYTVYGVAIQDVQDAINLQNSKETVWDFMESHVLDQDKQVLVKCYVLPEKTDQVTKEILKRFKLLKQNTADCGSLELSFRTIDGDDWIDTWKKYFKPIKIKDITISYEWLNYNAKKGEKVVTIGSTSAFGTGDHETTQLCIELMQDVLKKGDFVSDIGCGSGILAISALILGASGAQLTDIDSLALKSAAENAKLNAVLDKCIIEKAGEEKKSYSSDLTFANITSEVLIAISNDIKKSVKSGGHLILSGIIKDKEKATIAHFESLGFKTKRRLARGDWCAAIFQAV